MNTKDDSFNVRLWKIGSSVVFTIPSDMTDLKNSNFIEVSIFLNDNKFSYMMTPWKCGGSVVMTVPKQYIDAYNLSRIIKNKDCVSISLKVVDI